MERPLIKKDFDDKYPHVVELMHEEIDSIKVIYDAQIEMKKNSGKVRLHKNMPKVSGSLRWSHELRERLTAQMGDFKHLEHPYVSSHHYFKL